jgi:hypothetical protein
MKYLRQQVLGHKNMRFHGLSMGLDNEFEFFSTTSVKVPAGTTAERPAAPVNGAIRYNTTEGNFETFAGNPSSWKALKFDEPATITQETVGTGDDTEDTFGPLNTIPVAGQNILVLVENVLQLNVTNYELVQNPQTGANAPYADGWYIQFDSPVPLGKPVTVLHGFDR